MANVDLVLGETVIEEFNDLQKNKKYDYIFYQITDDNKGIDFVYAHPREQKFDYNEFNERLKTHEQPIYAVLDYRYDQNGQEMSKIFLICWCPETSKPRKKMLLASAKSTFVAKLEKIQKHYSAQEEGDLDEVNIRNVLFAI